ncbi:MAG: GH92 family glycosyl hydrolase, partial [Odoribacteraceae bacterium]|nr:GH92 family glycosyl hydrolase [Odoribacteraceae bacterium]
MKKRTTLKTSTCLLFSIALLTLSCADKPSLPVNYVDPYIGTGGHGHVFMGANVPFGLVQVGPTSIPRGWDWTSGYHISDTTVIGFSHTHLSGTGIGDLSDISLMPVTGAVTLARGHGNDPRSGMWSYFSRANERVGPGYYATRLDRYGIDVELTATRRVGFHRYTFPRTDSAAIVVDLVNGTGWDAPVEAHVTRLNEYTIAGYRFSSGWASAQRLYFVAVFSKPFRTLQVFEGDQPRAGDVLTARNVYAKVLFDSTEGEQISVKVALSPVSIGNAEANLQAELPGWDFGMTVAQASAAWNDELSKIVIQTKDESVKRIFYTALYHTMIAPSEFCDVNGDYRGADGHCYPGAEFVNYTTFSLWDTYRAAHPLMTIIHPERMDDIINTMLHIYRQQGKLPVWHLMGCETDCMVGNPAIPVVADAILKGYDGFDLQLAFEAMKNSAMLDERGMDLLKEYGYIPHDKYNESVATCMEYALADWALAQVAREFGKTEEYDYFLKRSKSYARYFDPATGFVRGLSSTGQFREPFDPFDAAHRANDYTEGNAWQYTWLVPHDVEGLIALFGSRKRFIEKLDSLFIVTGDMGENASPDISGLIGQYAHGNEPGHHIVYLYTMAGQPWKTADKVREILSTLYRDTPDGLSGNEDVGQMSAWYVLSALGFY